MSDHICSTGCNHFSHLNDPDLLAEFAEARHSLRANISGTKASGKAGLGGVTYRPLPSKKAGENAGGGRRRWRDGCAIDPARRVCHARCNGARDGERVRPQRCGFARRRGPLRPCGRHRRSAGTGGEEWPMMSCGRDRDRGVAGGGRMRSVAKPEEEPPAAEAFSDTAAGVVTGEAGRGSCQSLRRRR